MPAFIALRVSDAYLQPTRTWPSASCAADSSAIDRPPGTDAATAAANPDAAAVQPGWDAHSTPAPDPLCWQLAHASHGHLGLQLPSRPAPPRYGGGCSLPFACCRKKHLTVPAQLYYRILNETVSFNLLGPYITNAHNGVWACGIGQLSEYKPHASICILPHMPIKYIS